MSGTRAFTGKTPFYSAAYGRGMATAHDIDHDTPAAADIRAREAADKRISLSTGNAVTKAAGAQAASG